MNDVQAYVTGLVAGSLMNASADGGPFVVEVDKDADGNYTNVVDVLCLGQRFTVTVEQLVVDVDPAGKPVEEAAEVRRKKDRPELEDHRAHRTREEMQVPVRGGQVRQGLAALAGLQALYVKHGLSDESDSSAADQCATLYELLEALGMPVA